jgi:hypothetical protein
MQAIRQYAEIKDGYLHLKLPTNFTEKNVEVIILPTEKINQQLNEANIGTAIRLYTHRIKINDFIMPERKLLYDR